MKKSMRIALAAALLALVAPIAFALPISPLPPPMAAGTTSPAGVAAR